jgi:hypothetical protein
MDFKFRNSEYSEEIEKSEYEIRNVQNPGIFGIGISQISEFHKINN